MSIRNPFEVLGVSPEAEREVFRAAYRALAKKYHPDARQGAASQYATQRMAELNWAWEELQKDLTGWRARVEGIAYGQSRPSPKQSHATPTGHKREQHDEDAWWRDFTKQYRRPKHQALGWRAWIGSDVVCKNCGCVLKAWVYKCPDCMQTGTWIRSTLHTVGHKLRIVYWVVLFGTAYAIAVPLLLGLLAVPPILVIDAVGMGGGAVWEWEIHAQALLGFGVVLEVGIWAALGNWKWLKGAARKYWED